jgi:hypothetical protein
MTTNKKELAFHCGIHTVNSAIPSFIIALQSGINTLPDIVAMCLGVATFYVLALLVHLSTVYRFFDRGVSSIAIRVTKNIRFAQAFIASVLGVGGFIWSLFSNSELPGGYGIAIIPAYPDFLAGAAAMGFTNAFTKNRSAPGSWSQPYQAYFITIVEGCILAGTMFCLYLAVFFLYRAAANLRGKASSQQQEVV